MGSSGGGGSTTSYRVPEWQRKIVRPTAESAYEDFQKVKDIGPYQGQFIAGPTSQQQQALSSREAYLQNMPELGAPVMQFGLDTLSGKYLDPSTNPVLQQYIAAATDPVYRAQDRAHRAAGTGAAAQGAFGGSREAILQGEIMRQAAEEAGLVGQRLAGETYGRERLLQQAAPGLLEQGMNLGLAPSQQMFEVGQQHRAFDQDALNELLKQYQEQIEGPFRAYYPLTDVLGRLGIGAAPPTVTQGQGGGGFSAGGALSGGLGGAAAGTMLFPGVGTVIGGLLGAGAGGFL